MSGKTLRGTALQTERFQWETCVFLVILGLEIPMGPSEEPPRRSPPPPSSGAERGGSKALLVGQGPSEEPLRRYPLDKGLSGGAPKGSPFDRGPTHQPAPVALPPASRQTHQPVQPRCRHVPFALHAIRT